MGSRLSSVCGALVAILLSFEHAEASQAVGSAVAPHLDAAPFHQSPIEIQAGGLLLLPGSGLSRDDRVVYQRLEMAAPIPPPPPELPVVSTADIGVARVVDATDAPRALVVQVPDMLREGEIYVLRVRDRDRRWSNATLVNDPRPLWFLPTRIDLDQLRTQGALLRIMGRNLGGNIWRGGRVRLKPVTAGAPVLLHRSPTPQRALASARPAAQAAIARHVADFLIDASTEAGAYHVEFSAERGSWRRLPGAPLRIERSAVGRAVRSLGDPQFGGCRADDGRDDTGCLQRAFTHVGAAHVDLVVGSGRWDLIDARTGGVSGMDGLRVPVGVRLIGAGAAKTRIHRHARWLDEPGSATFTLLGDNVIDGIQFVDERRHAARGTAGPLLRLGTLFYRVGVGEPRRVRNITIRRSTFRGAYRSIADGGLPLTGLELRDNDISGFEVGLWLGGNANNVVDAFTIEDTVIAGNRFVPGSYLDQAAEQGSIAAVIGAANGVEFSDNIADGVARDGLQDSADPGGFRAAFFWHLLGNHQRLLVSGNVAMCSGDQIGDGEAIAFDNNQNDFPLTRAADVVAATSRRVIIAAVPALLQRGRAVDAAAWVGHWLQIVDGPGVGQARRIVALRVDAAAGRTEVDLEPGFESLPDPGRSRALIGRTLWQTYVVGNRIDHRAPPCRNEARVRPRGGGIGIWAQSADTVVAGNAQFGTDGIITNQTYVLDDPKLGTSRASMLQYSLRIEDNEIIDERDARTNCSRSGIQAWHSAAPTVGATPPVVSFGVVIARNDVQRADGLGAAAITVPLGWYAGPSPQRWPLVRALLVHGNRISEISGPVALGRCEDSRQRRAAIAFAATKTVASAVLADNQCIDSDVGLRVGGAVVQRLCAASTSKDCACAPPQAGDTR